MPDAVAKPTTTQATHTAHAAHEPNDDVREELRAYERAEAALKGGLWDAAIRKLRASLANHPHGQLVHESELSLLEAEVRAGHDNDVIALARKLEGDAAFGDHRFEIVRAHVAALVRKHQCVSAAFLRQDADEPTRALIDRCE